MMRASHSSYWSFIGGCLVSWYLASPGTIFSLRRAARLPLMRASKDFWKAVIWSGVHSFGRLRKASGWLPSR